MYTFWGPILPPPQLFSLFFCTNWLLYCKSKIKEKSKNKLNFLNLKLDVTVIVVFYSSSPLPCLLFEFSILFLFSLYGPKKEMYEMKYLIIYLLVKKNFFFILFLFVQLFCRPEYVFFFLNSNLSVSDKEYFKIKKLIVGFY